MEIADRLKKYETTSTENYVWENTKLKTGEDWTLEVGVERMSQHVRESIEILNKLISAEFIKENFTIGELFSGDASAMYAIKEAFPKCKPLSIDLLYHSTWKTILERQPDHSFSQADFLKMYKDDFKFDCDVLVTFNTYRGWDNNVGPLRHFGITKEAFEKWSSNNFKFSIVDGRDGVKAQLL